MKTIKGLDRRLEQTFGEDESLPKEVRENAPKFRTMILKQIGNRRPSDGAQGIELLNVGLKIRSNFKADNSKVTDEVDLEDAEFKLVYETCDKMMGEPLPALFQGQIMNFMNEARDAKKEDEKK